MDMLKKLKNITAECPLIYIDKALYTGMQRGYAVGIKILVRCSLIYSWKFIHPLMHVRCIPVPELLLLVCVSCIVI